jgi:hypothetical protein
MLVMAKFVIQSFSDIITNSSSEVFVSTSNEELLKALKELGIDYVCYTTEEELRNAVETRSWEFMELDMFNPYYEWWFEDIKKEKTSDECWEFFKSFYINLIGKIIVDIDRDYLYIKQRSTGVNIFDYVKE